MASQNAHFQYVLRIADNALILGQRLSEWCGHGPILEQDIAMTNIALDLIGQAKMLFEYAAELEGAGRTADDIALLRPEGEYLNSLLVEQPNEDFAYTIVRQFLFDAFHYPFYTALLNSNDEHLASIAQKAIKEISYHLRYSSEWMIRLGDGTALSHQKMQTALDDLWMYSGELCQADSIDEEMLAAGIGVDLADIKSAYTERITAILEEATLKIPEDAGMQLGGKQGRHTESMGYILTDMQYLQRTYPNANW